MAIIISGFPGVGKSCVATNRKNILDAESSAFSWVFDPTTLEKPTRNLEFPHNYIRFIQESAGLYDFILVSSHKAVREAMVAEGMQYIIVAPKKELKNEYLIRYLQRGSNIDFIELLNEKWDKFIDEIENDGAPVIWIDKGEHLSDVLGAIAR